MCIRDRFRGNDGGSQITALTLDMSEAGAATFNSTVTANAGLKADNITIDGTEIDLSSGDLTIDVAGDITLDADGGDIIFADASTEIGRFTNDSSDFVIKSSVSDKDLVFRVNDGGSEVTAMRIDANNAGRVSIGTNVVAAENLSVVGQNNSSSATFKVKDTDGRGIIIQSPYSGFGAGAIGTHGTNSALTFLVNSSEVARFGTNGFFGIATDSPTAPLEIATTSTDDTILLTSTEASSTASPVLTFKRNSGSPADADYLGQLKFKGENDADQEIVYAKVTSKILDASDGSEDGLLEFANMKAGTQTITARLRSDSLQLLNGTSLTVAGDATVTGDLTVNGTTTTVSTTNTVVSDSLLELGNGTSGTPSNDAGIVIERGSADNAFIGYDESDDKFKVGTGSFTGSSTGNLTVATGTLVANIEGNVTGNVTGSSGSTTGNAATATALETARNIAGQSFDGTGNITIASTDLSDTSSIALLTSSQTLTNKTIDSDNNTITNIVNADIKSSAAIAFSKMADLTASRALVSDGSGDVSVSDVTSTELGYLDGVSSAIQTQLDNKATKGFAIAMAIAL